VLRLKASSQIRALTIFLNSPSMKIGTAWEKRSTFALFAATGMMAAPIGGSKGGSKERSPVYILFVGAIPFTASRRDGTLPFVH